MTFLWRRLPVLKPFGKSHTLSWACCQFWLYASTLNHADVNKARCSSSGSNQKGDSGAIPDKLHLSPLFTEGRKHHLKDYKIELVDDETWEMTCGLAEVWKGNAKVEFETNVGLDDELDDVEVNIAASTPLEDPDFDAIEDMRVRNDLFYKIDKGSKEYEEHKFEYHGRKSSKNQKFHEENVKKKADTKTNISPSRVENDLNSNVVKRQTKEKPCCSSRMENEDLAANRMMMQDKNDGSLAVKKLRTLTFNQLTAPYHEPFCLDIYVSKGSVRASIIHRGTSKVVAVAHSISKDLKYDLASTKSRSACVAVGEVLAKRALDDDIHNVVYTPRKGEKLQGKLHLLLKTIIDYGIDVKREETWIAWTPPNDGWINVNIHTRCQRMDDNGNGMISIVGVFRDKNEKWIRGFLGKKQHFCWITHGHERSFMDCKVETDSMAAVGSVISNLMTEDMKDIIDDILVLKESFYIARVVFQPREANLLAATAARMEYGVTRWEDPPADVEQLLEEDMKGLIIRGN